MDNGKSVNFNANQMRHFDHGYAATSHSSQGLTAERVLALHARLIFAHPTGLLPTGAPTFAICQS
jgi:hypothetical protein